MKPIVIIFLALALFASACQKEEIQLTETPAAALIQTPGDIAIAENPAAEASLGILVFHFCDEKVYLQKGILQGKYQIQVRRFSNNTVVERGPFFTPTLTTTPNSALGKIKAYIQENFGDAVSPVYWRINFPASKTGYLVEIISNDAGDIKYLLHFNLSGQLICEGIPADMGGN